MLYRFAKLFRWWPIGILFLIEAILFATNYTPGTWLMGWDNIMPEFNFKQAFITNLFGVWQEHRGLGLYDGMGHAANLVHTLFLWMLSLTLPTNLLRYAFHCLMHFLGGVGAYVLLKKLIDNNNAAALKLSTARWVGLVGALFYQYNLATIQMFYTPLEAFSVHFAALPWLAWSLISYLQEGSRKRFLMFLLVSFLSTPQFFIPTLLLPIVTVLVSISITSISYIKRICIAASGFLLINAFWLLPFVYGLPHNAPIIQAAKINQMSSEEVYTRNQEFGNIASVLTQKGFPFRFEDVRADATIDYLMKTWRDHVSRPTTQSISFFLVLVAIIGMIHSLHKRHTYSLSFTAMFAVGFFFLGNDVPILRDSINRVRESLPALAEAYRLPFTKFSLLFALSLSVFISQGSGVLSHWATRIVTNNNLHASRIVDAFIGIVILFLAFPAYRGNFIYQNLRITLPKEYTDLFTYTRTHNPNQRMTVLAQPTYWSWKYYRFGYRGSGFLWYGIEQAILDRAFDPWSGYNENYYWELSRAIYAKDTAAFDAVFNKYDIRYVLLDENLISPSHNRALFIDEIKEMLAQIPSIKMAASFGALTVYEKTDTKTTDFVSLKSNLPTVSPTYRWTDNDVAYGELGDYIAISDKQEAISKTNYIYPFRSLFTKRSVDEREFTIEENEDTIFIHSLLLHGSRFVATKKKMDEQENTNKENRIDNPGVQIQINKINLRQIYHTLFPPRVVASKNDTQKPNYNPNQQIDNEKFYGIGLHDQNERSSSQIAAISETVPNSKLAVNTVNQSPRPENTVGNITKDPTQPADRLVNNPESTLVTDRAFLMDITSTVTGDAFRVNVTIPKADALFYDSTRSADLVAGNVKPCGVLREGEATAENLDQFLRFTSRNQRGCLSFDLGSLPHRDGYLVSVESRNISGRPLLFALINQTAKHTELETYLPTTHNLQLTTTYFILPPLAPDGLGYNVYLSNDSIGRQTTINDLHRIHVYRIPYDNLVRLRSSNTSSKPPSYTIPLLSVSHPNPSYYLAKLDPASLGNRQPTTLVLNQSYDPGWKAYVMPNLKSQNSMTKKIQELLPFLFGTELKNHVLVNNWANAWLLEEQPKSANEAQREPSTNSSERRMLSSGGGGTLSRPTTIIIFFWPQLLEWLGFLLLPIPFLYMWYTKRNI